jgi:RNA polymerase sigma factor (sigma-70 family)
MEGLSRGSVTTWLDALKAQQDDAAQALWNRYFSLLVSVARRHLRGLKRDADEEDIALSALKSAMIGVQNNRFPRLTDRTDLWPLLVTITAHKAVNEIRRQRAKKRDPSREKPLTDFEILGNDPSPDFALRLAEAIQNLVRSLGDDTLETIAKRKLEGYTNEDIATELKVSTRTIVRKIGRIRQEWEESETMRPT